MNTIDLAARAAIVTGGGQGIGYAIAERLLDSGASVSLWDRDEALLEGARNALASRGKVACATVDVTDAAAVQAAAEASRAALGSADILVACAGIAGPTVPSWEYPLDDWRAVIDVDLNGVYYCCRAVLPMMREQGYGRIVNVASIAGKEGNPNAAAYSAAKHPGRGQDPHLRPDHPGAHRLHAVEDPARTLRDGGGDRRHGRVDGLRGELVHHRRRIRSQRRPSNVLNQKGT
jgi:NADP-dependent 3-hydroxy acid dehydrogenase YdfG